MYPSRRFAHVTDCKHYLGLHQIIDEAHRVKNEHAIVSQVLSKMQIYNCIMLTGTPAQVCCNALLHTIRFPSTDFSFMAEQHA